VPEARCPNCGSQYDEAAPPKFCPDCGAAIGAEETPDDVRYCIHCGARVYPSHSFCMQCGRPIQASPVQRPAEPQASPAVIAAPAGVFSPPAAASAEQAAPAAGGDGLASWALGLGIGSLVVWILGPVALWCGIKSLQGGGWRARTGLVLGILGTLVLIVGVPAGGYLVVSRISTAGKPAAPKAGLWSTLTGGPKPPEREIVERVALSADQKEFVDDYGYPNVFAVAFDDAGLRAEVWEYYTYVGPDPVLQTAFQPRRLYFENGVFEEAEDLAEVPGATFLDYRPTEFDAGLTEMQVKEMMGEPSETRELDMQQYGKITALNYHKQIMFMFREGKLLGVMDFMTKPNEGRRSDAQTQ